MAVSLGGAWVASQSVNRRAAAEVMNHRLDILVAAAVPSKKALATDAAPGSVIGASTYVFDRGGSQVLRGAGAPGPVVQAGIEADRSGAVVRRRATIDGTAVRVLARPLPADRGQVVVAVVDNRAADTLVSASAWQTASALLFGFAIAGVAVAVVARRSTRHLEHAFGQEDRLLMAATHELRGPLGWMAAASQGIGDRSPQDALIEVTHATTTMVHLLDDLTEAARVLTGATPLADEVVALDGLLATLVRETGSVEDGVKLDLAPVAVRGSSGLLRRAVSNLIRNAARHGYGGEGGPILVRVDERGVTVEDEGVGVEPELLATLRAQIPGGIRLGEGGTGLGLALAAWVAQVHGGELILENRDPVGFRATLALPTVAAEVSP